MRTDTHRKYAALQHVSGAVNEAKRKRFFVYYKTKADVFYAAWKFLLWHRSKVLSVPFFKMKRRGFHV